ncbi:DNA-binding transcriptional regulator, MarR family [Burkholderia sp. YR290]|nr:DNA-binding transcriptional regulator, MarR family [Burkholderia sp. YR290]
MRVSDCELKYQGEFMSNSSLTPSVCIYGALRRATRGIGQLYDAALCTTGINTAQFNLLRTIGKLGTPSQSELAADMVMDLGALGHTLKPLLRDGWITLERDPLDGRRRIVSLTEEGQSRLRNAAVLWKRTQRRFDSLVGHESTQTLLQLLDHLASEEFGETFSATA